MKKEKYIRRFTIYQVVYTCKFTIYQVAYIRRFAIYQVVYTRRFTIYKGVYTRRIADQKSRMHMHTLSCTEKRVHVGKLIFGSVVFRPMVFGPWYYVQSVEPRYWVPSIGSKWFWTMVLSKA